MQRSWVMTAKREIINIRMVSRLAFKLCQWIPCPSLNEDPTHPNLNNVFTHLTILLRCTGIWMKICEYSIFNNLTWIFTISRYSRVETSHISVTQLLIGGNHEYMLINAKCEIINILMVSRLAFRLHQWIPCLSLSEDPAHPNLNNDFTHLTILAKQASRWELVCSVIWNEY